MLFCFLLSSSAYMYISSYFLLARNIYKYIFTILVFFLFFFAAVSLFKKIYIELPGRATRAQPSPHACTHAISMHALPPHVSPPSPFLISLLPSFSPSFSFYSPRSPLPLFPIFSPMISFPKFSLSFLLLSTPKPK